MSLLRPIREAGVSRCLSLLLAFAVVLMILPRSLSAQEREQAERQDQVNGQERDSARAEAEGAIVGPPTIAPLQMMRQSIGDRLPDTLLTDDAGREVRFFTDLVRNQAVVISFFYTNCRGTCPGTNLVLSDVRDMLAKDFGKSVRFISISVEPEKDDVAAISEYASQFRRQATDPDTPEWYFLTGKPEDIRELRFKLGYYEIDPEIDADPTQHAATVIIGNQATGRWGMMPVGIGADKLAGKVRYLAGWTKAQRFSDIYRGQKKADGKSDRD
jgi:protein SCO1/2